MNLSSPGRLRDLLTIAFTCGLITSTSGFRLQIRRERRTEAEENPRLKLLQNVIESLRTSSPYSKSYKNVDSGLYFDRDSPIDVWKKSTRDSDTLSGHIRTLYTILNHLIYLLRTTLNSRNGYSDFSGDSKVSLPGLWSIYDRKESELALEIQQREEEHKETTRKLNMFERIVRNMRKHMHAREKHVPISHVDNTSEHLNSSSIVTSSNSRDRDTVDTLLSPPYLQTQPTHRKHHITTSVDNTMHENANFNSNFTPYRNNNVIETQTSRKDDHSSGRSTLRPKGTISTDNAHEDEKVVLDNTNEITVTESPPVKTTLTHNTTYTKDILNIGTISYSGSRNNVKILQTKNSVEINTNKDNINVTKPISHLHNKPISAVQTKNNHKITEDKSLTISKTTRKPVSGRTLKRYPFYNVVRVSTGCSGTLLTPRFVLTAAHCIHNGRTYHRNVRNMVKVSVPEAYRFRLYYVRQVYIPRGWMGTDSDGAQYDYAVLRLGLPVRGSRKFTPLAQNLDDIPYNSEINYAGFPSTFLRRMWRSTCVSPGPVIEDNGEVILANCEARKGDSGSSVYVANETLNSQTLVGVISNVVYSRSYTTGEDSQYISISAITRSKLQDICKIIGDEGVKYRVCSTGR